jgi:glycopeptide antibiotics resistance protein
MKIILISITIIYLAFLFYIVLFTPHRLTHQAIAPPHFILFQSTLNGVFYPPKYNVSAHYKEVVSNFFGNILLFIPYGFLFGHFFNDNKKKVLLTALLISLGIEIAQLVFRLGVFDVDDIMLNITGAWAGIYILRYIRKKINSRA